ncbi:MAG: PEP-CTERM sorting domain-containing protein [Pseudomonadota bacterium]
MKTNILRAAAVAVALSFAAAPAHAAFIEGEITMSGDVAPTGGTGLADATGLDFLGDDFEIDQVSGDFATAGIMVGDSGTYNDFSFDPFTSPTTVWSIGGFSFVLDQIQIVFRNDVVLALAGTGFITGNGFDDTMGAWTLTANTSGALFNFSSSAASIDEPAMLGLLGLGGLMAFGLRRRRSA